MSIAWTTESIETLTQMRADGQTAAVIAEFLGTTRGAVLGKANRLGLSQPTKSSITRAATPSYLQVVESESEMLTRIRNLFGNISVSFANLERHHCRWPVEGWGKEMRYCGVKRDCGSYCRDHQRLSVKPEVLAEK